MKFDPAWFEIFSELLINLSAGWFGAAFIVPNFAGLTKPTNFWILTANIIFSILCLVLAFRLRKLSREI